MSEKTLVDSKPQKGILLYYQYSCLLIFYLTSFLSFWCCIWVKNAHYYLTAACNAGTMFFWSPSSQLRWVSRLMFILLILTYYSLLACFASFFICFRWRPAATPHLGHIRELMKWRWVSWLIIILVLLSILVTFVSFHLILSCQDGSWAPL